MGLVFDLAEAELYVFVLALLCIGARLGDHFGGHVDANHLAAATDLAHGQEAVEAAT